MPAPVGAPASSLRTRRETICPEDPAEKQLLDCRSDSRSDLRGVRANAERIDGDRGHRHSKSSCCHVTDHSAYPSAKSNGHAPTWRDSKGPILALAEHHVQADVNAVRVKYTNGIRDCLSHGHDGAIDGAVADSHIRANEHAGLDLHFGADQHRRTDACFIPYYPRFASS